VSGGPGGPASNADLLFGGVLCNDNLGIKEFSTNIVGYLDLFQRFLEHALQEVLWFTRSHSNRSANTTESAGSLAAGLHCLHTLRESEFFFDCDG